MTSMQIKEAAKKAGFVIVADSVHSVVIRKARGPITSVLIEGCTEKGLNIALGLKKAPKVKKVKMPEVETPEAPPAEPEAPLADPEPIDPPGLTFQEELESIKGIGTKTAIAIDSAYGRKTLIQALKDDLDITGVSSLIKGKLKLHFEID